MICCSELQFPQKSPQISSADVPLCSRCVGSGSTGRCRLSVRPFAISGGVGPGGVCYERTGDSEYKLRRCPICHLEGDSVSTRWHDLALKNPAQVHD